MIPRTGTFLRRDTNATLIALLLTATQYTHAQEGSAAAPGLAWNTEVQVRYDDNVYRTNSLEDDDTLFVLKPELTWVMLYGPHQFDLNYAGDYGVYLNEDNLDFTDHTLGAHALLDHSARLNTDYTADFKWGHDAPGTTDAIALRGDSPNDWESADFKATIEYGKHDSTGQLVGHITVGERRYSNNDQEFRDYDNVGGSGTFYYRMAPRTRLLFELDYIEDDYKNLDSFGSDQSSKEYRYLTGATWEATAKTTGVLKIGYRDRRYDNNDFSDLQGLYFSLDAIWQPASHTRVTVTASQNNQNSAQQGTGGFVQTAFKAALAHGITPRVQLTGTAGYGNDDFKGDLNRSDDRWNLALGLQYTLSHWLDLGIEYQYEERDSDLNPFDFNSNVLMVSASIKLGN